MSFNTDAERRRKFKDSITELSRWTDSVGDNALVSALFLSGSDPASYTDSPPIDTSIGQLIETLISVVNGGKTVSEFTSEINSFLQGGDITEEKRNEIRNYIKKFIRITYPGNDELEEMSYVNSPAHYTANSTTQESRVIFSLQDGGVIESSTTGVKKDNGSTSNIDPGMYAIEIMNPRVGMTTRDASPFGIFTSIISPVEMSRCVPYINISIGVQGTGSIAGEGGGGEISGLSLLTYINGMGNTASSLGLDKSMVDFVSLFNNNGSSDVLRHASMEVFTSPQTMVSPPDSNAFNPVMGRVAVLDRFRPFMSLNSLNVTTQPSNGWYSYKSAKMELVLHDRSRLAQIAQMVSPSVYQATEFDIEYGWSHSFGNTGTEAAENPMGAFLDGLKVREKYSLVNSSFNFDDTGQVSISLTLAMKGVPAMKTVDISMCETDSAMNNLSEAIKGISDTIARLQEQDGEKFAKLFDETILNAVANEESALSLDGEALQDVLKKLAALKKSGDSANKALVESIEALFQNGEQSVTGQYKKAASEAVVKKLESLKNSKSEIFPCADSQLKIKSPVTLSSLGADGITAKQEERTITDSISLGRLLMAFVGLPLVRSRQYDEVQFIFHTFNEYASFMRDLSIAKFPIQYSDISTKLTKTFQQRTKISCMEMIQLVVNEFVNGDTAAIPYGFRTLYKQKEDENGNVTYERGSSSTEDEKDAEEARLQESEKEIRILDAAGIPSGKFVLPKVAVYPECIPLASDPSRSVLRINVMDEACSSFGTLSELLQAGRQGDISTFGFSNNPQHPLLPSAPEIQASDIKKRREELIAKMKEGPNPVISVVQTTQNGDAIEPQVEIDVGAILEGKDIVATKKFISQGLPTLVFGRGGGMVTSAGLSSLNDPALATVNMMRMENNNAATPDMTKRRGLPLRITPTEVSVEMLGLPTVQYMQYVFVDFNTGTTADNIYAITGIDHKLEAGSFTTSLKLIAPSDAYAAYESPKRKVEIGTSTLRSLLGLPPAEKPPPPKSSGSSKGSTSSKANKVKPFLSTFVFMNSERFYQFVSTAAGKQIPTVMFRCGIVGGKLNVKRTYDISGNTWASQMQANIASNKEFDDYTIFYLVLNDVLPTRRGSINAWVANYQGQFDINWANECGWSGFGTHAEGNVNIGLVIEDTLENDYKKYVLKV